MKIAAIVKHEIRKSRQSLKRIIPVTLIMLAMYLFLAYTGNFLSYTGQNYEYLFQDREQLRALQDQKYGVVDQKFIQEAEDSYRDYVDRFRNSDEKIARELEKAGESVSVEDILYDHQYTYFVFDKKTLLEHPEIVILEEETASVIEYARDPVEYMLKSDVIPSYSEILQKDYKKCIRQYQKGKQVVAGYFLGWDMAVAIMQYLPATLGIVIVVTLFGIFARERRYQMPPLLLTAKYGKSRLLTAKLLLAWGITTLQWLIFQLSGLGMSAAMLGLSGGDCTFFAPMHQSVYGFNCIQYYLMQLLYSYLGTMFFMLAVCLVSCLLHDRLALICGIAATYATSIVNDAYWNAAPAYSVTEKLMALTPTQMIGGYNTFPCYQAYSFGSLVVSLPVMTAIMMALGIVVCLYVIVWRWHR